jgi:putative transposase
MKKEYKRTNYPSDLTDRQWEKIEKFFPSGNKSKYHKRNLVEAVMYVVKTGCQWRSLPHDYPPYSTVYNFYSRAKQKGTWEKVMQFLVRETRIKAGRNAEPNYALIDSQSVKTAYRSDKKGYDGGKKTKGIKRHIVTDIMGNILAVNVHKANQHDTKGGIFVFEKALFLYPRIIAGCADEGYRGTFKNTFEEFHNIRIDISKQIKPIFEVLPKRWRIERTFSWFGGYRRLSKDFEYLSLSEENIIYISHAHLLLSRL